MRFADTSIEDFLSEVAGGTATPGGGAVAAITGATGAALGEMVCTLTVDKEGYEDVAGEMAEIGSELASLRTKLLALADEDAAAFDSLMAAYKTPESEGRSAAIEEASKQATTVPLETAEACLLVLEHATTVTELGNENAVTDGGTGALLTHAALQAALYNVQINLATIDDESFVAETGDRAEAIEEAADDALDTVRENVESVM